MHHGGRAGVRTILSLVVGERVGIERVLSRFLILFSKLIDNLLNLIYTFDLN